MLVTLLSQADYFSGYTQARSVESFPCWGRYGDYGRIGTRCCSRLSRTGGPTAPGGLQRWLRAGVESLCHTLGQNGGMATEKTKSGPLESSMLYVKTFGGAYL